MSIVDISDRFTDVNPYDLIFSSPSGYTVKVRVEDISMGVSALSYRITGSWADDETGQARIVGGAAFIVEPHELVIRPDTDTVVTDQVQAAREHVVRRVERAILNHVAGQSVAALRA